jgi:hypothetical protein
MVLADARLPDEHNVLLAADKVSLCAVCALTGLAVEQAMQEVEMPPARLRGLSEGSVELTGADRDTRCAKIGAGLVTPVRRRDNRIAVARGQPLSLSAPVHLPVRLVSWHVSSDAELTY